MFIASDWKSSFQSRESLTPGNNLSFSAKRLCEGFHRGPFSKENLDLGIIRRQQRCRRRRRRRQQQRKKALYSMVLAAIFLGIRNGASNVNAMFVRTKRSQSNHCAEVAFALLIQQPRVLFSEFPNFFSSEDFSLNFFSIKSEIYWRQWLDNLRLTG